MPPTSFSLLDVFLIMDQSRVSDIFAISDDIGGATTDIKNSGTFSRLYDISNKPIEGLSTPYNKLTETVDPTLPPDEFVKPHSDHLSR